MIYVEVIIEGFFQIYHVWYDRQWLATSRAFRHIPAHATDKT